MHRLEFARWLLGLACLLAGPLPWVSAGGDAAAIRFATDVFTSGTEGYHTYRIPSLIMTSRGVLLAFCEGRKTSRADHGDVDLVLRRSTDGGRTWEPMQLVYEEGGARAVTIGNPCPVVDRETGTIWLTYCRDNEDVFVTSSRDDGRSWAPPLWITPEVKRPGWGWYATGPGVGIQLAHGPHRGRLVIPCDHGMTIDGRRVMLSHVIFSDDRGRTWTLGGTVDRHTDECQVVELSDGELLINMRNYWGRDGGRPDRAGMRAVARSRDGGASWSALAFDATLIEPVCQASLIAVPRPGPAKEALLVFANPASKEARRNLTARVSRDQGRSWPVAIPVDEGPSAYSCLAALPGGSVGLLYERADYRHITFTEIAGDELAADPGSARPATAAERTDRPPGR